MTIAIIDKLKQRERDLLKAHKNISAQIDALLNQRIKIVGAIEENQYMQKQRQKTR
jgi:hypothetical protein